MTARACTAELTVETVAKSIDLVVLAPDHTLHDVEQACATAVQHGFASVCLAPYAVGLAARLLRGSGVNVCGAVGMPLGYSGQAAKCDEARTCIEAGAGEIDMVLNIVAMKSARYADVQAEIAAVRKLATGLVLKVTLECCYLTDTEKARACKLAVDAGADFVKTGTGFGRSGATVRDVHLLKIVAAGRAGIEAAGGLPPACITRFRQVQELMRAGAARIASPDAAGIIEDFYKWEAQ